MLLNAYTIHDCKALQYHSPWFAVSDGAATRILQDLVNDMSTMIGRHPRDYTLWRCGIWDDSKGAFAPSVPLEHVVDAIALLRTDEQQPTLPGLVAKKEDFERILNGKEK